MITEIDIADLKVGHYVAEISKQEENFSLTHPGHIKSDLVIKNLIAKGVKQVKIDTSKTKVLDNCNTPLNTVNQKRLLIKNVIKAKAIFNESKAIQRKVFEAAQHGKALDLAPVFEITNNTIDEVFKNSDALACVINIRNKDEYLLEHSVSVSVLITIFARFLNIERAIVEQLSVGAFLHDVGKIMVPNSILNKPSKLTDAEFETMKSHVVHSIDIINNTPGISPLSLEVAAQHHEKLDGLGYPYQLTAEEISQYGRMITICDIFDALTAHRCYKDGYSHIKSFNILRGLADKNHLDKQLVDSFIKCMGVYPVGSLVELNSNKIAIVEQRNYEDPISPKVRSFYNCKHHHYVDTSDIDLSKEDDFIVKGVRADDFDLDMNKIIEFLLMEG